MTSPVAVVPIRDFLGMTRLSEALDPHDRSTLALDLATRAITAAQECGLEVLVVSSDDAVSRWAAGIGVGTCPDPGGGLSAAARAGTAYAGDGLWLVIHADLPLITSWALERVAEAAMTSTVVVPSQDGGTTIIAGRGDFPFSYGVGSFQRHLAAAPDATVLVSPTLSIDIDTPRDLAMLRSPQSTVHSPQSERP